MNDKKNERVFISYVKENTELIDKICEVFENNQIEFWLDRNQIDPGKMWKMAIEDGINTGSYFLACFSKEYQEKSETYMNEELAFAIELLRQKQLNAGWFIPIKLSPCEIPRYKIGAGMTLQDLQYIDLYENWDVGLNRIIDLIKREEKQDTEHSNEKYYEMELTYRGLKSIIENGTGFGFHNADPGHPVYKIGATDSPEDVVKAFEYADTPEKNMLFKMLSKLSIKLKSENPEVVDYIWWYDFSDWRKFCTFATEIYDKRRRNKSISGS